MIKAVQYNASLVPLSRVVAGRASNAKNLAHGYSMDCVIKLIVKAITSWQKNHTARLSIIKSGTFTKDNT